MIHFSPLFSFGQRNSFFTAGGFFFSSVQCLLTLTLKSDRIYCSDGLTCFDLMTQFFCLTRLWDVVAGPCRGVFCLKGLFTVWDGEEGVVGVLGGRLEDEGEKAVGRRS